MSYIAFDLDAMNRAPAVARACGLSEDAVLAGLLRLWAWCFREETDTVQATHIRGHFGGDAGEALEAFGFLEATDQGTWRVRGAARYLRIKGAQRAAAERTNQRKVDRTLTVRSTDATPHGGPHGTPHGQPTLLHRAPNTEHRAVKDPATPPAPRAKPAGKAKAPADPRHAPLVKALVEASPGYAFQARDAAAVTSLLALGPPEEVLTRWRRALASAGYPKVRTTWELAANWNHFAQEGRSGAPIRAEDVDWSQEQTGFVLEGGVT